MVEPAHRDRRRRARSPRSGSRSRWPTSSASSRSTPTTRARSGRSSRSRTTPTGLPDAPDEVLASMGNYVFDADALVDAVHPRRRPRGLQARHGRRHRARLRRAAARPASTTSRTTTCPAATDRDRGYWRDVGTHRLLLRRAHGPRLDPPGLQPLQLRVADLHRLRALPAGQVRARLARPDRRGAQLGRLPRRASSPAPGSTNSVLSPRRHVHSCADGRRQRAAGRRRRSAGTPSSSGRSSTRTSVVPEGAQIGIDHEQDRARGFHVTESGITVVGKGQVVTP